MPQLIFGAALLGSQPAEGGRERRTRKSVNYAEPKLNTYVLQSIFSSPDLTWLAQKNEKTRWV